MDKGPRTLVDDLAEETLAEMADTFFGSRVEIERVLSKLAELAGELRERLPHLRRSAAALRYLLLDRATTESFYDNIGVLAEPYLQLAEQDPGEWRHVFKPSFALTSKGRWTKSVLETFGILQSEVEVYLHGRYEPDSKDPRRKRLTANYNQVRELADASNRSIEQANKEGRPSDVMCYMRSLDPLEQEKERCTGATLEGYSQHLDESMAMVPLDFESLGLVTVQGLPRLDVVRGRLEAFLASVHRGRTKEIHELMRRLKTRGSR
ncbi:hypothetical protein PCS_00363 [Desulfocurvibacter africanus PCS]|uniref:Uncharacterized protein n=1 Tax=Desulfocurvibacter africanus PCS TaxID=1262666 RepID=M5PWP0_DESAF|nr:hypothetical protein PCS_00363 [Desulfocurvibacter africanus PCS]